MFGSIFLFEKFLTSSCWNVQGRLVQPSGKPASIDAGTGPLGNAGDFGSEPRGSRDPSQGTYRTAIQSASAKIKQTSKKTPSLALGRFIWLHLHTPTHSRVLSAGSSSSFMTAVFPIASLFIFSRQGTAASELRDISEATKGSALAPLASTLPD